MNLFAAIRIRGSVNVNPRIKKTLELLRAFRVNHLVLVKEGEKGMLQKAQGFLTWGEIDAKTLGMLLEKRGRFPGNKRIGNEFLKEQGAKSFEELATSIIEGKASLQKLGLKPVFRLNPPKKGYERAGIKKSYSIGGALGYRASDINALIKKMA